jgi:hypothetical protein
MAICLGLVFSKDKNPTLKTRLLFSNFIHDFTERATVEVDLIIQYQHRIIPVEVKVAENLKASSQIRRWPFLFG